MNRQVVSQPRDVREDARQCSAEFDRLAAIFDRLPIAAKHGPEQFRAFRPSGQLRALDVGCGTGNTVIALASFFESVVGVDLSTHMLQLASRKLLTHRVVNASLARMEASALGFSTGLFDYVVSHTALHHSYDVGAVLREFGRVVAPGGRVIVVDIVGPSFLSADVKMRIASTVDLIQSLVQGNLRGGVERFKAANHPTWLAHLKKERFPSTDSWEAAVRTALPGARIQYDRREFWTTKYITVCWDKPRC